MTPIMADEIASSESCNPEFGKADIVNHLAAVHGFRHYLEYCSVTTGNMFAKIARTRLLTHRLMYRCPDEHSDGLNIDFRSGDEDVSHCVRQIQEQGLSYDVVLVDPFHEYGTSWRDLEAAFSLIRPGGCLVVHDCLPPDEALAAPQF